MNYFCKIGTAGFDSITINNFQTGPNPIPADGYDNNHLLEHYNLPSPTEDSHISTKTRGGLTSVTICGDGYCLTYGNRYNRTQVTAYANIKLSASTGDGNNLGNFLPSEVWNKFMSAAADLQARYNINILANQQNVNVPAAEVNKTIPLYFSYPTYSRILDFMRDCDADVGAKVMEGYTKGKSANTGSLTYCNDIATRKLRMYNKREELQGKAKKKKLAVAKQQANQGFYSLVQDRSISQTADNESDYFNNIEADFAGELETLPDMLRFEIELKRTQDLRNFIRRDIKTVIKNDPNLTSAQKKNYSDYYDQFNALPLCWITDDNLDRYFSSYVSNLEQKMQIQLNAMAGVPMICDLQSAQEGSSVDLSSATCNDTINCLIAEDSLRGMMLRNALKYGFDNGDLLAANFLADVAEAENATPSKTMLLDAETIKDLIVQLPLPKDWGKKEKDEFYHCFEKICNSRYHNRYVGQLNLLREIIQGLTGHQETTIHMS